jgi:hypothetical protein
MAIGVTRVNGGPVAGGQQGYQTTFYLVAGTNVGTADTGGSGTAITEGNWSKALRTVAAYGSIVFVGPRADNGFVVGIDEATASAYVSANTDTDVAAAIQAAVRTVTSVGGATVTAKTLALADFA